MPIASKILQNKTRKKMRDKNKNENSNSNYEKTSTTTTTYYTTTKKRPRQRSTGVTQRACFTKPPSTALSLSHQSKLSRVGLLSSISRQIVKASAAVSLTCSLESCTTTTIFRRKSVMLMYTEEGAMRASSRMTRHAASLRCHCSASSHW